MQACTIIARNYLAQARVLASSFLSHHPDGSLTVLIVDQGLPSQSENESFEVLGLDEIGLDPGEAERMAMIYNVVEFCTAVKPWLLRHLLQSSPEVIYLDSDVEVFAPLDDLLSLAGKDSIVLTPHVTEPMPRDKLFLSQTDILSAGIFNLGFIAVGRGCEPFLDWWSERLRRECMVAPDRMRFTDQRWIDFVPAFFPHHILRDPGCNVGYWNLYSRKVTWTGQRYEVNGQPLRFFHFSGYHPGVPFMLSAHQRSRPRSLLSEHPGVARLCRAYSQKLTLAGFNSSTSEQYGWDRARNGLPIDRHMRQLYREALAAHENEGAPEPPNPFTADGADHFIEWLNEPVVARTTPAISRYLMELYKCSEDLRLAFPDAIGSDAPAFHEWVRMHGAREKGWDERLLPRAGEKEAILPQVSADGSPVVTIAGYFHAELGVGEAARLLLTALDASGTDYNTFSSHENDSREEHPFNQRASGGRGSDINILCVNADQITRFAQRADPNFFHDRYTVGLWFWEVETFPVSMHSGFKFIDELWVASDHIREALEKVSPKPVFCVPLPISARTGPPSLSRAALGLPESFLFLFSFDFLSIFKRKNPLALIKAFTKAFRPGEGPALLIKSINGDQDIFHLEELRWAASERPDIRVMDSYLSTEEKEALMAHCDCYVSLHRAEGFGLTLAEAMAWGNPTIGTNYSGNLMFMTGENSFPCAFDLQPIGPGAAPYGPDGRWAEPDIEDAARLMRYVYENPEAAAARGRKAREDIRTRHSPAEGARFIRERIAAIRRSRAMNETVKSGVSAPEVTSRAQEVPVSGLARFFARQKRSVLKRWGKADPA